MEYTDLKIIDCNRQHSIQVKSGNSENTALFTNELGRGIQLDVGDKVSVQGAYISEVGAGADTIEFKGEKIGKTRTIKYIKEVNEYPSNVRDYDMDPEAPSLVLMPPLITGFQRLRSEEDTFTYDVKDNETYITNQYYLNLSGDSGYVLLPRRFAYPETLPTTDNTLFNNQDDFTTGRTHKQIEGQVASCDYSFVYGGNKDAVWDKDTGLYKISNDNSRLTLMRRIDVGMDLRPYLNVGIGYGGAGTIPSNEEPCRKKYAIYQDYFKVSADKGFTAPDNLAQEITKQFKKAGDPQVFQYVDHDDNIRDISVIYSTNTYKPFLCASVDTFREDNLVEYLKEEGTTGKDILKSQNYYSNYYNIYCKRPELRIAGQELNTYTGLMSTFGEISYQSPKTEILTNLIFNDENLLKLKKFIEVQALYPELFDNDNFNRIVPTALETGQKFNVDNVRFLHMNTEHRTGLDKYLGGDNMDQTTSSTTSKQSVPLFFFYDKNNKDKKTDGTSVDDLCYGFATKNAFNMLALHPEKLSRGINGRLFGPDENIDIADGTIIGYDWSFNAYGSVCAVGLNGRSELDYGLVNNWGVKTSGIQEADAVNKTSGLLRYNYVGSINPIFKYENDHFNIEGLHTPELAGQVTAQAGDNGPSPTTPDNTPQGGVSVYKINKRINQYVYTPDMKPYDTDKAGKYTLIGEHGAEERTLSIKNRNIKSWAIFDSICGVFFTDLGYDKEDFQRGLFGILGFRHKQVSGTITADNNRNTRISQDDSNGLLTTNSLVAPSDTRDYIVNQFGAVFFTTQIPTSSVIVLQDGSHPKAECDPAISQSSGSFKVVGTDLPRKMLNPYYTIRSDIIDSNHYVGGEDSKSVLPVVAICDKQYSGGDFVFGAENEFTFTITKKKVITTITTAITDPNQSFARVDDESAVIYKIMKNVRTEEDLISNYLKGLEKQRKK